MLEVIVTDARESAIAQNSGADRLELIRDLAVGGLSPSIEMVHEVLQAVSIPVRVMVRQSANFLQNDLAELKTMQDFLSQLSELKIDGIVLGFVNEKEVDETALRKILDKKSNFKVTFHRAFEATEDPFKSISVLKKYGQIDKILTNGGSSSWGASDWHNRIERLQLWQQAAEPVKILVGGEVDAEALLQMKHSSLTEFHVGRSVRTPETTNGSLDPTKIKMMSSILSCQ